MRRMKRILLIEDDAGFREMLTSLLKRNGFAVEAAHSAPEGLSRARRTPPDLLLTDWSLGSRLEGVDICAHLKKDPATRPVPVVVLTGAKVEFEDELAALRHGADLYLTKHEIVGSAAGTSRFLGYVRSLLRRPLHRSSGPSRSRDVGLHINLPLHTVKTHQETISDLSTKQFDLLYLLAKAYPRIAHRRSLLRALWRAPVLDNELAVAVSRLKARIEREKHEFIETVHRKGYRLRVAPSITAEKSPAR